MIASLIDLIGSTGLNTSLLLAAGIGIVIHAAFGRAKK